jgi:hypothetical protein
MAMMKLEAKLVIERVLNAEFAKSGGILSKNLLEKRSGVSSVRVREHYDEAVSKIPDLETVQEAYREFLEAACDEALTPDLVRLGSAARLTARRIAKGVGSTEEEVKSLAEEIGAGLSSSELPYGSAGKLVAEDCAMILASGVARGRAHEIADVSEATFDLRLSRLGDRGTGVQGQQETQAYSAYSLDLSRDPGDAEAVAPTEEASDGAPAALTDPRRPLVSRKVFEQAARIALARQGRDPDSIVPGVYRGERADRERLICDWVELIDGRETPVSAAYKIEADKIAGVVSLVAEASGGTSP